MVPRDPMLLAATLASLWFFLICVSNVLFLRRTRRFPIAPDGPKVSLIVPARNEESNIGDCLQCLRSQTYRNLEIIVVDDNSDDLTGEIARRHARADSKVRVIDGRPVPTTWNGKQFACNQGVEKSDGELIFMTDADVRHKSDSVARAVGQLQSTHAHFL